VRNLISQLQLPAWAVTSLTSVNSTAHAADAREILTVIGNCRPDRNVNKRRDVRVCVLKPIRRFSAQTNQTDLTLQTTEYIPSLYRLNAAALSKPCAIEHLTADLNGYKSDIAVITETHFKAKHSDGAVEIAGYNVFRRDRERRKGGGVAVYVNSAQQAIVWRPSADDNTFELLWIRTCKLFIGVLYHPPKPLYQPEAL